MNNWRELLKTGTEMLSTAQIDDSGFEAYQLLLTFFNGNSTEYALHSAEEVSNTQQEEYFSLLKRRISGEPLQYIIGKWDFYNSTFFSFKECYVIFYIFSVWIIFNIRSHAGYCFNFVVHDI